MANRTNTYSYVTRDQLQNIRQALVTAGIAIYPAALSSLHNQPFDAGTFSTNGYDVSYSFLPSDSTGSVGDLVVKVSGSMLFIGTAMNKIDARIQPYLAKV